MKKKMRLVLYYLCFFIFGLFIVTFLYVAHVGCVNLVAGRKFLITKELILLGFVWAAVFLGFLTPVILSIYKIRHLEHPVSNVIIYTFFNLVTWFLLFPTLEIIQKETNLQEIVENEIIANTQLSGGYFRKSGYDIYYFLKNANDGNTEVLRIYPVGFTMHSAEKDIIDASPNGNFSKGGVPFKDLCIKETFDVIPNLFIVFVEILSDAAFLAWSNGVVSWLCFCTLGIALASVYCYAGLSSWKLVNFIFVILTEAVIFCANVLYLSSFGEGLRLFFNRPLYENGGWEFFFNRGIELPLCVFNVLVGISVITVPSILKSVRRKKAEE